MNIVVIGTGYVGLVTGCCLAEAGNHVVCVDRDNAKIATLGTGRAPFYEPGLNDVLKSQLAAGRLTFETRITAATENADLVFLAVGTPPDANGHPNLDSLLNCVRELAQVALGDCLVVVKSTVPVGTADRIEAMLNNARPARAGCRPVRVASNPEFLAEGRAVQDFRQPDRIVIGSNDPQSAAVLERLYDCFDPDGKRLLFMDRRSAEFGKYACNAMLAARISMVNELAGLAGRLGADIHAICRVMAGDPRIGAHYLRPGVGFGGSCLPKDLRALIGFAHAIDEPVDMLNSTQRVNQRQVQRLLHTLRDHLGCLTAQRIAIWGLAFKPDTDDVRAAPSLALIRGLLAEGARVSAYDPAAMVTARQSLGETSVFFGTSALEICDKADALVLMTEWNDFRDPDFRTLATLMRTPRIFDARALYHTTTLEQHGIEHYPIGTMHERVPPDTSKPRQQASRSQTPSSGNAVIYGRFS